VSWLNFETGGVAVELTATPSPGGIADPGSAAATGSGPVTPAVSAAEPAVDSGTGSTFPSSDADLSRSPGYSPGPTPDLPATPADSGATAPEPPPEATLNAAPELPGPALRARPAVGFWDHVPAPTTLLLPLALGLAVLVSVTLGPAGRPSPVFRREGGLSRALARRKPGADAA
jgi:hypothetical protein